MILSVVSALSVFSLGPVLAADIPFSQGLVCARKELHSRIDERLDLTWTENQPRVTRTPIDWLWGTPGKPFDHPLSGFKVDSEHKRTIFVSKNAPAGCETGSGRVDGLYVYEPTHWKTFLRGDATVSAHILYCDTYDWVRHSSYEYRCRISTGLSCSPPVAPAPRWDLRFDTPLTGRFGPIAVGSTEHQDIDLANVSESKEVVLGDVSAGAIGLSAPFSFGKPDDYSLRLGKKVCQTGMTLRAHDRCILPIDFAPTKTGYFQLDPITVRFTVAGEAASIALDLAGDAFTPLDATLAGTKAYWDGGSGPGSLSYWKSGTGPGSAAYWNAGDAPGSKAYWDNGDGPGSRAYWYCGKGPGSKLYWKSGWNRVGTRYGWDTKYSSASWSSDVGAGVLIGILGDKATEGEVTGLFE
jgi:hypothetical protein